jgi:hypothetical protein
MRSYGAGTAAMRGVMGMALVAALGAVDRAEGQNITWYNGTLVNTDTQWICTTDPPLYGIRMQGYVGYGLHPGSRTPAVGEIWYAHLVLAHPGNQCAGGSATHVEFYPPPNTQLAVSVDNPLFCFWRRHLSWGGPGGSTSFGTLVNVGGNCNQNPGIGPYGGYNLDAINPSQPWPFPNYSYMEFLVPLRSTAPLNFQNLSALINPAVGVFAQPTVPVVVNNDVLFRDGFGPMNLYLDICTIPNTTGC